MTEYTPTTEEVETHWADIGFAGDRDSFRRWLQSVKAEVWDRCVGEMPLDLDWKIFYQDNNPYQEETE